MESLIFVPIERLEERYSDQWYGWFMESFHKAGIDPIVVGDSRQRKIKVGQFLDVMDTCRYKADQMSEIISHIQNGFEGKIVFMDYWFPGVEHLAYIRDNAKKHIEIIGILHAGTWDEHDFLTRNGCEPWAKPFEEAFLSIADKIIVATEFHKNMIWKFRAVDYKKIEVADFPCYQNNRRSLEKENIVVFPHRLAPEKQPEQFVMVEFIFRENYPGVDARFVRTKDACNSKQDYYDLLEKSKVAFSSALQETFGIAMLEAVALGCVPVAPNRLSYRETLAEFPLYNSLEDAAAMIYAGLVNYKIPESRHFDNADAIIKSVLGK